MQLFVYRAGSIGVLRAKRVFVRVHRERDVRRNRHVSNQLFDVCQRVSVKRDMQRRNSLEHRVG